MLDGPGAAVIDEAVLIDSTPEQGWHAIVDGDARSRWCAYLGLDVQPGGRLRRTLD